jgi:hypothetical protein
MSLHLLPRQIVCAKSLLTDVCIDNLTVEYADLGIIDFSKVDTEEGRAELADQVKNGLRNHGFLYIVNHGYTQEEVK